MLSYFSKCQAPPEKLKIDLAKKVCLVVGNANGKTSIGNGIVNTLSDRGAKVYIAEPKTGQFQMQISDSKRKQVSRSVIPIQGENLVILPT